MSSKKTKTFIIKHPNSQYPSLVEALSPEQAVIQLFTEQDLIDLNIGVEVLVRECTLEYKVGSEKWIEIKESDVYV